MILSFRTFVSGIVILSALSACGGGSDSSPSIDISNLNSVSTKLKEIIYPDSYQRSTTDVRDVNTDICNLDVDVVTFSRDWLGNYPLPEINGAPLQSIIIRGASIRDIMLNNNPAFIEGCTGNLRHELERILDRFSLLGVETVYIPQWHWVSDRNDESWYIVSADNTFGPLSDSNLTFFASSAKARGMQVAMFNQIQGFVDEEGDPVDPGVGTPPYIPDYTSENLAKWFAAYQDFVAERSVFFESIGIDIWEVGCSVCIFAPFQVRNQAETDLHAQEYEKAIDTIRTNFSGKLLSFFNLIDQYPNLLSKIDLLGAGLFINAYTESEMVDLTVGNFKATLLDDGNQNNIDRLQSMGKPILFHTSIQSRNNALTEPGYLEETQCTSEFGALVGSEDVCLQREVNTDFSIQAIYWEAVMEFLNTQTYSHNPIVMIGDYWVTDSIVPSNVFPNISLSFRNKPAEGLIKAWFAR